MAEELFDQQAEGGAVTESRRDVRRPPLYKVVLHNDDFTTQEFVVLILERIFHHDPGAAWHIMMHVHRRGSGIAGLFPYEIAEAKVARVHDLARAHDFPLKCSIEEE